MHKPFPSEQCEQETSLEILPGSLTHQKKYSNYDDIRMAELANGEFESGITIGNTFSVSEELVIIKQEPQDYVPEEPMDEEPVAGPEEEEMNMGELMEEEEVEEEEYNIGATVDAGAEVSFADQPFPEYSDIIMRRAVSPPTYDLGEDRIKDLLPYYIEKYDLKEVQVELERCDKIWETLQLIKNIQSTFGQDDNADDDSFEQSILPTTNSERPSSRQRVSDSSMPDFRFSIKSKRKMYYCVTCGEEYVNSDQLKQHAINEHGFFVSPKRIYKPRADSLAKAAATATAIAPEVDRQLNKELVSSIDVDSPNLPIAVETTNAQQAVVKQTVQQVDDTSNNSVKSEGRTVKTSGIKEKIKCVLCKRICTDIVYHMKGYHKVGCISSIIAQCEKVSVDNTYSDDSADAPITRRSAAPQMAQSSSTLDERPMPVSGKKRKRGTTSWTVKKKYKFFNKNKIVAKQPQDSGPYKCPVCLGYYKSRSSFAHHKALHRLRGETPDNFNPSNCRFFNSPFHVKPNTHLKEEVASNHVPDEKETLQVPQIKVEECEVEPNEGSEISQDSYSEQTSCECGRSFRNYHTFYLHKVKCRGFSQNLGNDTDSSTSISIKIKKNKNNSYQVVTNNIPMEDNSCKDSRSSKDSDASSNDSGMVSVDYNSHGRAEGSADFLTKNKTHSILRIQVAEDDEEVDIEDGEEFNENVPIGNPQGFEMESDSLPENDDGILLASGEDHAVPSLNSLCKQALTEKKQPEEIIVSENLSSHKVKSNCPCGKNFKNFKYLNIHVRRYHPLLTRCTYCTTNFDCIEKYIEHQCKVMEGKLFIEPIIQTQCNECKALVDLGEPFDKHMKTHNLDSATFQCFKCDLRFDNQHQRKSHFNLEHGFALCRICSKLMHIDHLSKHEAYHDGLGHPCHICKKAYAQKPSLKRHNQNTHDPNVNQVVKCLVCFKEMKLKHLQKHLSFHLHSEICKKCDKCLAIGEQGNLENSQVTCDHRVDSCK